MKIIRVFPSKTRWTPDDANAVINRAPTWFDEADEIHISVLFKHDISQAYYLAHQWEKVAPVKLGGVAFDEPGGDFVPGMYVKQGAVITSRGCNNRCWFCSAWRREGKVRELPITEGWNVLDDNLLACREQHVKAVFAMLAIQKQFHRVQFTGGFEARLLKDWHIDLLLKVKPEQMFFAYDTDDDLEPLVAVSRKLRSAGFTRRHLRCYVLVGYERDTFRQAEARLRLTLSLGFNPMAMLYMNERGQRQESWREFQRVWSRPAIIYIARLIKACHDIHRLSLQCFRKFGRRVLFSLIVFVASSTCSMTCF